MQGKNSLPIYEIMPQILDVLQKNNRLVLQAPPGAGKTTSVPLELLKENWLNGKKIIMLEPRRIAVRSAAYWMSKSINDFVGNKIGYSVHLDKKLSKNTVLEIVTEGVFINKLLKDPELRDVAIVIFDEFHERSLDADLSLALLKETQEVLREDLKILIMSATLDTQPVAKYLNNAPIVTSKGKSYPVNIKYTGSSELNIVTNTVKSIITALNIEDGSILVFLPGVGEIKRVEKELKGRLQNNILIQPLYGGLSREEQEKAIESVPSGMKKIVLSTSIAESSITINGIKVVIDSGLIRKPIFNPKNGMNNLKTLQISRASADQRTGRGGRIEPGVCYRLWENHRMLEDFDTPEIINADFTSALLTMAKWGYTDINDIYWLTKPNNAIYKNSLELLRTLGAINNNGITEKGIKLSRLPLHPRLGSIIATSNSKLAADLAVLLSEKDILIFPNGFYQCDIRYRLEALEGKNIMTGKINTRVLKRVKDISRTINTGDEDVEISRLLITSFETVFNLNFIKEKNRFSSIRRLKLGYLTIKKDRISTVSNKEFHIALLNYLQKEGLKELNWNKECISFRNRVNFLHSNNKDLYTSLLDEELTKSMEWLKPYIGGISIKNRLEDIPLLDALKGHFKWDDLKRIETEAPTHFKVPSGSNIPIDYSTGEPILRVRLQELFGLTKTPTIFNGKVSIILHLLSPASRPIQITRDLKSFWDTTYSEVKKDLMGRYPKHYWPRDPYSAIATNRIKR
ncbi:MAG: ATP-dependent helicase HrpB [Spirochaetaceae bacterium 4572_7]|nr:MAG: ATP-dependent helicase HrpB [Spirochaetaceae bacterium 4572_7]